MPLYEYYCEPCNGVFELIRPARDAARPQPCPECDGDAKRIMSREFAAFIYRDGMPRRLPDRGKFWRLHSEGDAPLTGQPDEWPEAKPRYLREEDEEPMPNELAPTDLTVDVRKAGAPSTASGGFFKKRARGSRAE